MWYFHYASLFLKSQEYPREYGTVQSKSRRWLHGLLTKWPMQYQGLTSGHTHNESKSSSLGSVLGLKFGMIQFIIPNEGAGIILNSGATSLHIVKKSVFNFSGLSQNYHHINDSFISYLILKFLRKPTMEKKFIPTLLQSHFFPWQYSVNDLFFYISHIYGFTVIR